MTADVSPVDNSAEVAAPLPLLAKPKNPRVELIESSDALAAAVAVLGSESGPFALDAERASGFRYSSRAYLVQVQRGDSPIYLIDPSLVSATWDPSALSLIHI